MFIRIVLKQARYRWGVTVLIFLTLTALVTLYVYLENTSSFSNRSMQIIMKRMGHNLLVLPDEADPLQVYLCTDDQMFFDESATETLAQARHLASKYYVSVLQRRAMIANVECLLTGVEPVNRGDESKEKGNDLILPLKPGQLRIGATVAARLQRGVGETLDILGSPFTVHEVLPPQGDEQDFRVYMPLKDAQRLFELPGKINLILSFECLHGKSLEGIGAYQDRELPKVLPGFRQIRKMNIATGRYFARDTTARLLHALLAMVLTITLLIIAITGVQEVTERKREIGMFTALGFGYPYIITLYLFKMALLALAASALGFAIGSHLSVSYNADFLASNTRAIRILWSNYPPVAFRTLVVALAAQMPLIVKLIWTDPSATLREE